MSNVFIKNPHNGDAAQVNSAGRLLTSTDSQSLIGSRSDFFGQSFTAYGKTTLGGTANENIFYLKNTGVDHLHLSSMTFSSPAAAMKIEVYVDSPYVSGGYNLQTGGSVSQVKNLNLGSGNTPNILCLDGRLNDLSLTVNSEDEILDVRLSSGFTTFTYRFDDALIIPRNHSIMVLAAGTNGDKVRVATQFFFEQSHG